MSTLRDFPAYQCRKHRRLRFDPWVKKIHWSRKWQPTLVFLSGKWHGQRSLEGYSPWGCKESDMTEHMSTHTHSVRKGIVPPNNSLHGVKIYGIRKLYQTYTHFGNSLVVQWLEFHTFTAKGQGSFRGWGIKTPQDVQPGKNFKDK